MLGDIDLQELSFEDIGSWPYAVRLACIILACAAVLAAGIWFDTRSQLRQQDLAQRQHIDLRHTFEAKHHQAANLPAYKAQLVKMKHEFGTLLRQLPASTEVPGLLEDISALGHQNGLKFILFKPLPENAKAFYLELPIEIKVLGDYHQLAKFVSDVSGLSRIVTLGDFEIMPAKDIKSSGQNQQKTQQKPGAETILQMSVTAKTYRYKGGKA